MTRGSGFHLWLLAAVLIVTAFVLHYNSNVQEEWKRLQYCVSQEVLNDCDRH